MAFLEIGQLWILGLGGVSSYIHLSSLKIHEVIKPNTCESVFFKTLFLKCFKKHVLPAVVAEVFIFPYLC